MIVASSLGQAHLPSLRRGERIETSIVHGIGKISKGISPRSGGGSGLKLGSDQEVVHGGDISPRFGGGSGLKHSCDRLLQQPFDIASRSILSCSRMWLWALILLYLFWATGDLSEFAVTMALVVCAPFAWHFAKVLIER